MNTPATGTYVYALDMRGADDLAVEVPTNVGPLGGRKSEAAAKRLLTSYDDVAQSADVVEGRVERMTTTDGHKVWVALFEYNRPVNR